jgi:hypothetical protein
MAKQSAAQKAKAMIEAAEVAEDVKSGVDLELPMEDSMLVPMEKDGERLYVHRSCVDAHKNARWKMVG